MITNQPDDDPATAGMPSAGPLRRTALRVAEHVPFVRGHLERDRERSRALVTARHEDRRRGRALETALERARHAEHDRDQQAAALAARTRDGAHGALAIGQEIEHRPQRPLTDDERAVIAAFHDLYYTRWREGQDTINVGWLGWRALKCPLDLWVYQELIVRLRPSVIVETGTHLGGSAYYLASILDLVGSGEVVTIDIRANHARPIHPRVRYLTGSSVATEIVAEVERLIAGRPAMVILDSDHSKDHVLAELRAYASLVPIGSFVIVEDSNVNGHPTWPDWGPGPYEAVDAFLAEDDRFVRDDDMERFLMTLNPGGYLRRVA